MKVIGLFQHISSKTGPIHHVERNVKRALKHYFHTLLQVLATSGTVKHAFWCKKSKWIDRFWPGEIGFRPITFLCDYIRRRSRRHLIELSVDYVFANFEQNRTIRNAILVLVMQSGTWSSNCIIKFLLIFWSFCVTKLSDLPWVGRMIHQNDRLGKTIPTMGRLWRWLQ